MEDCRSEEENAVYSADSPCIPDRRRDPGSFVDIGAAGIIADPNAGNFMNYLSMMTGDAFNYGTIFAMSITPYINSSIIMQLLTVAIPALETD